MFGQQSLDDELDDDETLLVAKSCLMMMMVIACITIACSAIHKGDKQDNDYVGYCHSTYAYSQLHDKIQRTITRYMLHLKLIAILPLKFI